jgi:uncharacterized protein YndB with AHSA1/START domain
VADILHAVSIRGTPQQAYAALTEQSGLAGWWTKDTEAQAKVGSVAKFRFGKGGGPDMEIVALVPDRLVHWRCCSNTWSDEWVNTELTFEIEPRGEKTTVKFSHRRWMQESDFMRHCSQKWATFLLSLKSLVEQGKGAPAPDDMEI